MNLKTKSKIYKYTGLYLAKAEEKAYMKTKEFNDQYVALCLWEAYLHEEIVDILIGSWQFRNGFCRTFIHINNFRPKILFNIVEWVIIFLKTLKFDLVDFLTKK